MATIAESTNQDQLAASLASGISTLSLKQQITFTLYTRQVLPLDGWIFWLNTGQTITVEGSLHYSTDVEQREDETIGIDSVIFTTTQQINDLDISSPNMLYIGTIDEIRFSFKRRGNFYKQANVYHYQGDAIYPAMESQIIDNPATLDLTDAVVSNSLPFWLSVPNTTVFGMNTPSYQVYPSFLVPNDLVPPYIVAHIEPSDTIAIQSAPEFDATNSHYQLTKDKVRLTFYGLRNAQILDFQDYIFQYSLNTGNIGIMNIPIVRDEKRMQAELGILGMKKFIEFEVNYYQSRINVIAQQAITSALISFTTVPFVPS